MAKVAEILRRPFSTKLRPSVRAAIRTHQSLASPAATTTRSLALDVLSTTQVNRLCAYHTDVDKHGLIYDGSPDAKFMLNGVPKTRLVPPTVAEGKDNPIYRERVNEGYMHCGCKTDHALLDFYFWKSLTLTGTINGQDVTEPVPRWSPRERAFVVKIFEQYTFLTVDDLYTKGLSPELHEEKLLQTQLERILERYNELRETRDPDLKRMALVEVDESDEVEDEWSGFSE
ncbi:hypothetical protein AX14_007660 [Amanita brunnescens Koide BX004]|nr:hypothetical protein AX14_007660 [Amanita brunnescens Koide BX004]